MAATARLGPTVSSTISSTAPLFGLAFGVLVLGEALTWPVAVGTFAIFSGVVLLSWSSAGTPARGWPLWALLLPVGAALIRVFGQGFAKIGMEEVPSPLFVGLMTYSVSFVIAIGNAWRRGQRLRGIARFHGAKWFVLSGVCYAGAIFFLNSALRVGDLIVVSPVISCQPLLSLALGYLVFRENVLTPRVALAVLVVVSGVVLIGIRSYFQATP